MLSFPCEWEDNLSTLETLILASKSFTLLSLSGNLANFTLATLASLHYNTYINIIYF